MAVKASAKSNSKSIDYDSDDDKPIVNRQTKLIQGDARVSAKEEKLISESEDDLEQDDDDHMPIGSRNRNSNVVSEDSDDDKPISARNGLSKGKFDDDSDDELPLSLRSRKNSNIGSSSSSRKYNDDFDKDKSLNNCSKKVVANSAKRPLEKTMTSSCQKSNKKAKLSVASTSAKAEVDDDDEIPIARRMNKKSALGSNSKRVRVRKNNVAKVKSSRIKTINKKSKKIDKKKKKTRKQSKYPRSSKELPKSGNGKKWSTLVHNGVIFPPEYQPHGVKMLYDGKPVDLTPEQEEVATMYAVMLETDYVKMDKFNENFFNDWKELLGKNHVIQDLRKCDFTPMYEWHIREKEKKNQMTSEEKKALKEEKLKREEKYMWAILDGVKEQVGNFRIEPPGLFRGRGESPKTGRLKKRIYPRDVTINIGKEAPVPECPIPGQRWKEVRHDNTVTWLAFWDDPTHPKRVKYVNLAANSSLKGQSDKEKYEKASKLKDYIQGIRAAYTKDFTNKNNSKRQIAVATYLIDRLALRAGNEKDDEEAETVGCCTLKVENVKPLPPNILEFDFLGKDSIKYHKQFEADPLVFKAVVGFRKGKSGNDDLFDELDTSKLNAHLKELMPGLTAKVFRTFNASLTLDNMLAKGAGSGEVVEKRAIYQRANKEVAIICNHQHTVSKSHSAQMEKLITKINEAKAELSVLEKVLARAKKGKPPLMDSDGKRKRNLSPEAIEKKILSTKRKIEKYERDMQNKEDVKEVALGTSKTNYLDPRISVAWCKRNEVPIERVFTKSQLAKFSWAMDVDPSFRF